MTSIGSWAKKEMTGETVGVVSATCESVMKAEAVLYLYTADTAGIGGDVSYIPNTLIVLTPAVVVVGVRAVKYGNCSALLKLGLVDASEVSGVWTDSLLVVAGCVTDESGSGPTPVLIYYLVTCYAVLACWETGACMTPNTSGFSINLVGRLNTSTGAPYVDSAGT